MENRSNKPYEFDLPDPLTGYIWMLIASIAVTVISLLAVNNTILARPDGESLVFIFVMLALGIMGSVVFTFFILKFIRNSKIR